MKAASEVVPQALPPALTCFLRGLLTLYVSPGRNDTDENGIDANAAIAQAVTVAS
jgi:hypothetical protein